MIFRLVLGQITFNPVENAFSAHQLAVFATSIAFYCIVTRACAEFLDEKVIYVFSIFGIFLRLSFFSFSFLFATLIYLLLGFLVVKNF